MEDKLKEYFDKYFDRKEKMNILLFNTSSDEVKYDIVETKRLPISFKVSYFDKSHVDVFLEDRRVCFKSIFSVDIKTGNLVSNDEGRKLVPTPYGWYYDVRIPYGRWAGYTIHKRDGHHYIEDHTPLAGRGYNMETGDLIWMS